MRIIHKADYGLEERIMFKPIVYANAIHSMSLILHAVERLGIDLDSEESEYDAYVFYQLLEEQTSHTHALVEDIKVTKELSKVGTLHLLEEFPFSQRFGSHTNCSIAI